MALEVFALRFGRVDYPTAWLFDGPGEGSRTLAHHVFLLRTPSRNILVDTGFLEPELVERWHVRDFTPVAAMLERVGLSPADVADVILTHGHPEQVGGLRDFLHARIWVSRDELEAMDRAVHTDGPERDGYRWEDLQVLGLAPRLHTFGRRRAIAPFVRVAVVSGHTPGCLAVTVLVEGLPRLVLAGDNAWLYENLEGRPMPSLSRTGGHDALPRLRVLAGDAEDRYTPVAPGVIRLFP